jgi:hypothetical protein
MPSRRPPPRRRRKARRRSLPRPNARVFAVGIFLLVGLLYYRPLSTYFNTRAEVGRRAAEVQRLRDQRDALRAGFTHTAQTLTIAREARQLSYVRPGERLYVISGIAAWRRAHPHAH